jgi:hypothetical protein
VAGDHRLPGQLDDLQAGSCPGVRDVGNDAKGVEPADRRPARLAESAIGRFEAAIGQLVPVVVSQLGYSQAQRGVAFEQGEHSRVGSPGEPVKDRSGRAFTFDRRTSGGNEITRASPGRAVSTMS